jgi:hypothetical protein
MNIKDLTNGPPLSPVHVSDVSPYAHILVASFWIFGYERAHDDTATVTSLASNAVSATALPAAR